MSAPGITYPISTEIVRDGQADVRVNAGTAVVLRLYRLVSLKRNAVPVEIEVPLSVLTEREREELEDEALAIDREEEEAAVARRTGLRLVLMEIGGGR